MQRTLLLTYCSLDDRRQRHLRKIRRLSLAPITMRLIQIRKTPISQ